MDRYGRPSATDWIGMANMVTGVMDSVRQRKQDQAYSQYMAGLTMNPKFKPDTNDPNFSGIAWHKAQQGAEQVKQMKIQNMMASNKVQRLQAKEQYEKGHSLFNSSFREDGTINEESRKQGILEMLKSYDHVNDGFDIRDDSIDFGRNVMIVEDLKGNQKEIPIPSPQELNNMAKVLYDAKGFDKMNLQNQAQILAHNQEVVERAMANPQVNNKGQSLVAAEQLVDPTPGLDGKRFRRTQKESQYFLVEPDGTTRKIDGAEAIKLGFNVQASELANAKVDTEKQKAETEKAKQEYYRGTGRQTSSTDPNAQKSTGGKRIDDYMKRHKGTTYKEAEEAIRVEDAEKDFRSDLGKWVKDTFDEYEPFDPKDEDHMNALKGQVEALMRVHGLTQIPKGVIDEVEKPTETKKQDAPSNPKDYYLELRRAGKSQKEARRLTEQKFSRR